jgi:hypothetical protein
MNWEMLAALIRHLATFGGGYVVANSGGTITDVDVQSITGAVIAIGGIIWSIIQKRRKA